MNTVQDGVGEVCVNTAHSVSACYNTAESLRYYRGAYALLNPMLSHSLLCFILCWCACLTCPLASTEATPVAAGGRCCRLSMVSLTRPRIPPKPTAETGLVSLRPAGASKAPLDRAPGCPVFTPRASRRAASRGQPRPIIRRRCRAAESEVAQPAASGLSGGVLQRHESSGWIWASTAS